MAVVNLIGGLGNQMFQYAFGRSLQEECGYAVTFDTKELLDRSPKQEFTYRDFELGVFAGDVALASAREVALFKYAPTSLSASAYYKALRAWHKPQLYREKQYFAYDPQVWQQSPTTYFDGYWQTECYFAKHADLLKKLFAFRHQPVGENAQLTQRILSQTAVSLHVRRGDYVSNNQANQVHGICSPAYYEQAVRYVSTRIENPILFIFSDEPEWVRQNMTFAVPAVYVSHNHGRHSFEDMRLMSLCQHNIIANSSFSWWGAWLNANPDKIVVAPQNWMNVAVDIPDLIPAAWIRL